MNRQLEIENFLKYYRDLFLQNNDLKPTKDMMYYGIVSYGLNDFEKKDIKKTVLSDNDLDELKSYNMRVYVDERQPNHIQLRNLDKIPANKEADCYKLYLSFPEDKIKDSVINIFKYIGSRNMSSASKVSKWIRSDALVIRLYNKQDVIDLVEFINKNHLNKDAKPVCPFTYSENNIGFAYDKWLSYNSTISEILKNYYIDRINNNNLSSVNLNDFKNYVESYTQAFYDDEKRNNLCETEYMKNEIKRLKKRSKEEILQNYQYVVEMLNNSLNISYTLDDYISKTNELINNNMDVYLNNINNNNPWQCFEEACLVTKNKYGENNLILLLKEITKVPDYTYNDYRVYKYFSNDFGARDNLINNVNLNDLYELSKYKLEELEKSKKR